MKKHSKLQQPIGVAGLDSPKDTDPPLHPPITTELVETLSVEHAAIALQLNDQEAKLVILMGRGFDDHEIAVQMESTRFGITKRIERLKRRTRMSRMSLSILGYHLAGQHKIEFRPAA